MPAKTQLTEAQTQAISEAIEAAESAIRMLERNAITPADIDRGREALLFAASLIQP